MRGWWRGILLPVVPIALGACAADLPDASPFVESTAELRQSVDRSFDASSDAYLIVAQTLDRSAERREGAESEEDALLAAMMREEAAAIDRRAEAHERALIEIQRYAAELSGIVGSAAADQEKVQRYAEAVADLAERVGGIEGIGEGVRAVATFLADAAQRMRTLQARRDLHMAMQEVSPQVAELADALAMDIVDLRQRMQRVENAYIAAYGLAYDDVLLLAETLDEQALDLARMYRASPDPPRTSGMAELRQSLRDIAETRRALDTWLEPVRSDRSSGVEGVRSAADLLTAAADALTAWGSAHAELAADVELGMRIDSPTLREAIAHLEATIAEFREWRESFER